MLALALKPVHPQPFRKGLHAFLTFFLLLGLSGCFDWKTQLDAEINYLMVRDHLQGVGLVIVQDDQVLFQKGFGHSNRENLTRVDNQTMFRTGSISKLLTSTAIMQLEERGLLDLDQPLTNYLPEFFIQTRPHLDANVDSITIRDMLTHRSGIPSDFFHTNYEEFPPTLEEYSLQFSPETLAQTPGEFWSYSNAAMTILGHVIERVSGEPFEAYVQTNILTPLAMNDSSFSATPQVLSHLATPYFYDTASNKRVPLNHLKIAEGPAGGFFSNLDEMSVFLQSVLNDARGTAAEPLLLQTATYQQMFAVQNANNPLDKLMGISMGLGWFVAEFPYGKVASHGGDISGFHNELIVIPEQNIAVYATTNSDNGVMTIRQIAQRALELALQFERSIDYPNEADATAQPQAHPLPWTAEQLATFAGHYSNPSAESVIELESDGEYLFNNDDGEIVLMQLMSDNSVWAINAETQELEIDSPFYFHEIEDRQLLQLQGELWARYDLAPTPAAWLGRLGHYHAEETLYDLVTDEPYDTFNINVELKLVDGFLHLELDGDSDDQTALVPYDDFRAHIPGLGRGTGESVWFDADGNLHIRGVILRPGQLQNNPADVPEFTTQLVDASVSEFNPIKSAPLSYTAR